MIFVKLGKQDCCAFWWLWYGDLDDQGDCLDWSETNSSPVSKATPGPTPLLFFYYLRPFYPSHQLFTQSEWYSSKHILSILSPEYHHKSSWRDTKDFSNMTDGLSKYLRAFPLFLFQLQIATCVPLLLLAYPHTRSCHLLRVLFSLGLCYSCRWPG